jgi:hypothetical protein
MSEFCSRNIQNICILVSAENFYEDPSGFELYCRLLSNKQDNKNVMLVIDMKGIENEKDFLLESLKKVLKSNDVNLLVKQILIYLLKLVYIFFNIFLKIL